MNPVINFKKGLTLTEVVIYVTIFAVLATFIITTLLQLSEAYVESQRFRSVTSAATVSIERMVREMRDADSVVTSVSELGESPGVLKITKTDASDLITETLFFLDADSTLVMVQSTSTVSGEGGGSAGYHEVCTTNSDCSASYPVCCNVPIHGPGPVCEDPTDHSGICGVGIISESEMIPLTPSGIEVSNLVFRHISGVETEAVKIEIALHNRDGKRTITEKFYDTIVLRGSYD